MFPDPENNSFMKKEPYTVQSLVIHKVSLVYAVCTLLLCFGGSISQSFAELVLTCSGEFWTLSRMWEVLTRCTMVCLLKET